MCTVDKKLLARAMKLEEKTPMLLDFGLGERLDESILDSFLFTGLQKIQVPISTVDVKVLSDTSNSGLLGNETGSVLWANQEKNFIEIEAIKLTSFMPTSFLHNEISSLASTVICRLGINPGVVSVEAHLQNLSVFPPGGYMKPRCVNQTEPGMFSKMILQIPVEGGHKGGKLKMKFNKKIKSFDLEQQTYPHFFFGAMLCGSELEVEPVVEGWMVLLTFNLVWRNAFAMTDSPFPLPIMLTALNEIAEALRPWNAPTVHELNRYGISGTLNETSAEEIIVSVLDGNTPSKRLDYSSDILNTDIRIWSERSNMLLFLLEGTYSLTGFGFTDLTGQDQLWARLFSCSQFLDVHLAVITQSVSNVSDLSGPKAGMSSSRTLKIEHWINSTNSLIKLNGVNFDLDNQVVGDVQKLKNFAIHEEVAPMVAALPSQPQKCTRYHPVLVIWPKPQTIRIYCQYGFNAVLDRMEMALDMSPMHRQELVGDFGIILSFCRAEPVRVWRDPGTEPGKRAYRLLRLCLFLRARDEGLELLEILGTDFNLECESKSTAKKPKNTPLKTSFEGIRTAEVAKMIAEYVCLISGWTACCSRILAFVSPTRIVDQFLNLICLVESLLNRDCFDGATELMDCISFALVHLKHNLVVCLKGPELEALVKTIISMEGNPKTSNPQRLSNLVALFPRLDFQHQCGLVVELQSVKFQQSRDIPCCQEMFSKLCQSLSISDFKNPPETVLLPLLICFLKLGQEGPIQPLIKKIAGLQSANSSESFAAGKDLLGAILESPEIWVLAKMSKLGKSTVIDLITIRLNHFISLFDQPLPVLTEEVTAQRYHLNRHSWMMEPRQKTLVASVADCVHLVYLMEREKAFENGQPIERLSSLYSKLSLDQIFNLVLELRKIEDAFLKDDATTRQLFVELCQIMVDRSKEAIPQVPHDVIIEVIKTLIWLGDVSLIRALVKQICLAGSGGSWDPVDKNQLLETILSSPESWSPMTPDSNRLIRDSCTALIGAWIVGLCRILDQSGSSLVVDGKTDGLRSKIANCVNVFMRTEKSQPRSDQPNITTFFSLLLSKLSVERLFHLILDLRNMDTNEQLKQPPCYSIFRDVCQLLVSKDLVPAIKCYGWLVTEVWKCLLWFDDASAFQTFTMKILDAFLPSQENPIAAKIVSTAEVRLLAKNSSLGRAAFTLFVEQRIGYLKTLTKPFLSWDHPYAVFPGHPEVEVFLRSSQKMMTYPGFPTFSSACKFAVGTSGTKNGYSIRVDPIKVGNSFQCKIEKMLSRNALLKKEVDELADFIESLKREGQGYLHIAMDTPATSTVVRQVRLKREVLSEDDEVCIIPVPKRSRDEEVTFL